MASRIDFVLDSMCRIESNGFESFTVEQQRSIYRVHDIRGVITIESGPISTLSLETNNTPALDISFGRYGKILGQLRLNPDDRILQINNHYTVNETTVCQRVQFFDRGQGPQYRRSKYLHVELDTNSRRSFVRIEARINDGPRFYMYFTFKLLVAVTSTTMIESILKSYNNGWTCQ